MDGGFKVWVGQKNCDLLGCINLAYLCVLNLNTHLVQ